MPFVRYPVAALHEAAHAVVANEYNKKVLICSIGGDPTGMRHTGVENAIDWRSIDTHGWTDKSASRIKSRRIRRLITTLIAGDVIETIEYGSPPMSESLPAGYDVLSATGGRVPGLSFDRTDLRRILFLIQNDLECSFLREMRKAEYRAARILLTRMRRTKKLAKIVLDRGFMDGIELQSMLRSG